MVLSKIATSGLALSVTNKDEEKFIIINGQHSELVRISMKDGKITFGPDYNPDEAARVFWEAIGGYRAQQKETV